METSKEQTLEEISNALEIVENERASEGLTKEETIKLENASLKLKKLERSIIKLKETQLINQLTEDGKALKELIKEMKNSAGKLEAIAKNIEKVSTAVEQLIKGLQGAIVAGLI